VSTKPDVTWLKDAIGKGKGRALQAIELYQQHYKDKIERQVKAAFDLHGVMTNKERMAIHCRIVSEMWKAEDEDIIAEITGEVEKQKKSTKKADDENEEKGVLNDFETQSPEEYNAFVILFLYQLNSLTYHLQCHKIPSLNSPIGFPSEYSSYGLGLLRQRWWSKS
jgi:hypothetical protein